MIVLYAPTVTANSRIIANGGGGGEGSSMFGSGASGLDPNDIVAAPGGAGNTGEGGDGGDGSAGVVAGSGIEGKPALSGSIGGGGGGGGGAGLVKALTRASLGQLVSPPAAP
jgi:hypothetical protein